MKKIIMLFPIIFIISIVTSCSDYMNDIADDVGNDVSHADIISNLILYFPFSESNGLTAKNYGEYGDNLVLKNSTMFITGKYGNGIQCGTTPTSYGDWFSERKLLDDNKNFTISMWINVDSLNTGTSLLWSSDNAINITINNQTASTYQISIQLYTDGYGWTTYQPITVLNTGSWYNPVITFDGHTVKTYINSLLVQSGTYEHELDNCDAITLGQEVNTIIDEFRFYKRVLNEDEIALLMKTGMN